MMRRQSLRARAREPGAFAAPSTHAHWLQGATYLRALFLLLLTVGASHQIQARSIERELRIVVTMDAQQEWTKNDPAYPGPQWSKGKAAQRWEIRTRLRSDGVLHGYDLLDPDLDTRMWAKTAHLARQAKRVMEGRGQPFSLPRTEAEKTVFMRQAQEHDMACKGDTACRRRQTMESAAIMAAIQNPELLEPDDLPGRYLYFEPFPGCAEQSRVQLTLEIDGVRYNKDVDKFVPFNERRSADTSNATDGLALCDHFLATLDTGDPLQRMRQETLFVPTPAGITQYTEKGHTSQRNEPQPLIGAVLDWAHAQLRHAATRGQASTTLPLPLSLNGNSTWLGQWTGTAKATVEWSFDEIPPSPSLKTPQ